MFVFSHPVTNCATDGGAEFQGRRSQGQSKECNMASALYQSIELLSRDKGIDPGIVVTAVEDAIALATRKFYKTQENMRAELDKETGEIRAYVYKTVVETPEQI